MRMLLIFASSLVSASAVLAQAPMTLDTKVQDEKVLRKVGLGVEGPALLEYLRRRTYPEADAKVVTALISRLGADEFNAREEAQAKLLSLGSTALVGLKLAEKNQDSEVRSRAEELRNQIEAEADAEVQAATARLIGINRVKGATEILLNYLPFAADRRVVDEIAKSLALVGVEKGVPAPSLVKALTDRLPVKRGAAAEALVRGDVRAEFPTIRKLLADTDHGVRFRAGLSLVRLPEERKEAVPALIDCLAHLSRDELWPAEEVLVKLADGNPPMVPLGINELERKLCRDAWAAWWDKSKNDLKFDVLDKAAPFLGHTLLVQQTINRNGNIIRASGKVCELNADRKEVWSFEIATYPVAVDVVSAERVVIAEFQGRRVAEYDIKGKPQWEQIVNGNPIGVQRLPNGNTFVVMQNRIEEYTLKGKRVFEYTFTPPNPNSSLFRARKASNGEIVFVTNDGTVTRLDAQSRQIHTFKVGQLQTLFGNVDVLPNGNVLVPLYGENRVVEYDRNGKQVAQFAATSPNSATRLPDGNTLVTCQNQRPQVIEFDRDGRRRWTMSVEGNVFNARAR